MTPSPDITTPNPQTIVTQTIVMVVAILVVALGLAIVSPMLVLAALAALVLVAILRHSEGDAVALLSMTVAVLFIIPARFVIEALGAAGTPSVLLGTGLLVWWLSSLTGRETAFARGRQPVRIGLYILGATALATYGAGWTRALSGLEGRNADRTLIVWLGFSGVLLLAADGITTRARFDALARRFVAGATFMAVVGIVQFLFRYDISASLGPPGLAFNVPEFTSTFARSDFTRVAGTALHPIEFGVVAATMIPLALHFALHDEDRPLALRWAPVALLGFAVPMALSRSAILAGAVGALVLLPSLRPHHRLRVILLGLAGAAAMTVVTPGLLGTIKSYFLRAPDDPSITSRTDDFDSVESFFREAPVFGRGFGTFTPVEYDFLDNQFFMTLIESGLVGLVGLIVFLGIGWGVARAAKRRAPDRRGGELAAALSAAIAGHIITFATYDAMVFRITGMSLFLLIGMAGALWRIHGAETSSESDPKLDLEATPDTVTAELAEIGA